LPAEQANGAVVTTLAGLSSEERDRLTRAFLAAACGGQCGYCLPAIALHASALVEKHPAPTTSEIERALDLHLCRCTGYVGFVRAIDLYARDKRGEAKAAPLTEGGVGASVPRAKASAQVLGERDFVADISRPNLLHGAVLLSAHARAGIVGIDTTKALALPGVVAVVTAKDVPGNRFYGLLEQDWPGFIAEGEEARAVGDVLVAIAAEDEATARRAAELVAVEYDVREPVVDPEMALLPSAPRINPRHDNLLGKSVIRRGDAAEALAKSAHVARGTFRTQRIEHLFLEPECALAEPLPDGRLRVYSQGQGVYDDLRQIASFLGVDESRVEVELVPNGGAFGGKEDLSIQAHAALLAVKTGRPVKLALSREQSICMHPKRHPMRLDYELGCDESGNLTALRARILGDSGAYASVGAKVLERAAGHAAGPYRVPSVDVESVAAYTNNPPCGAMRGFGVPQVTFALEACIDELADACGIDRWAFRFKNAVRVGDMVTTGQTLEKSVGIERCLLAVAPAWEQAKREGRAVGIACGIKNSGIGNGVTERGRVVLRVESDGTITLFNGFTEMGQGLFTVLCQLAAEVTGLPLATFSARVDTDIPCATGQTTGSRGTLLSGRAVEQAARLLRADLDRGETLASLSGKTYDGEHVVSDTTSIESDVPKPKTHTSYGFAVQVVILDAEGKVEKVVAAHDVGRALNPALCKGQIEGAVHMGLGYALTEELACEQGKPKTFWLREIGVLRARDMPEVEVVLVEEPEPEGPFGAKGVGEIGLVPTAAAVAGALQSYDGVRRRELPMKDSPAALAMSVGPHHALHTHPHTAPSERVHHFRGGY
jgi:xanthine dehydrogenase molybdenum-binding subunit